LKFYTVELILCLMLYKILIKNVKYIILKLHVLSLFVIEKLSLEQKIYLINYI